MLQHEGDLKTSNKTKYMNLFETFTVSKFILKKLVVVEVRERMGRERLRKPHTTKPGLERCTCHPQHWEGIKKIFECGTCWPANLASSVRGLRETWSHNSRWEVPKEWCACFTFDLHTCIHTTNVVSNA